MRCLSMTWGSAPLPPSSTDTTHWCWWSFLGLSKTQAGTLVIAPQEIEVGDGTNPLVYQMLQCSLQFASSMLSPAEVWTAQVTVPIRSLGWLFYCFQISRHSFNHIQPTFKTKVAPFSSFSPLACTAPKCFPCQSLLLHCSHPSLDQEQSSPAPGFEDRAPDLSIPG